MRAGTFPARTAVASVGFFRQFAAGRLVVIEGGTMICKPSGLPRDRTVGMRPRRFVIALTLTNRFDPQ